MTASGTMFFISIFSDVVLPAALLERKGQDAGVLWGTTASFSLVSLFENRVSASAGRALELSGFKIPVYWIVKCLITRKIRTGNTHSVADISIFSDIC